MEIPPSVINIIYSALEEDIGQGDVTTNLLIPEDRKSKAYCIAKENFVLAGLPFVREVFMILDHSILFKTLYNDGSKVKKGNIIAEISGKTCVILKGERVSLNILQRLSGIATLTNRYVEKTRGLKAKIVDTRKTTPCHRFMEKYAVKVGGGYNHRFGLFDGILIKDNHIKTLGSIKKAVREAKKGHHLFKIEVEVKNLKELKEAIESGADIIMLDNMSVRDMKEAVKIAKGRVMLEASGNISLENVREVAETGVDLISVGALTHSAPAVDISLKIVK
ncbi:MAG TPA: carboxylating nicotinate-nucleotide diphosphorylase [Thermodesulfovibrionales bacterium]|nr:carboxylating nicotinate-nucleotide diphosphorylase [Thermodesulfovibrionales bacterium]